MAGDWAEEVAVAAAAALEAGRAVMLSFGREMEVRQKAPDQPLTAADLEANRILHERLLAARPDYGWLSEETGDDPGRRRRRRLWIVDPIDGTRSFIARRREFSISVGIAENGQAQAGVILNPATGELYATWRGGGAWKLEGALAPAERGAGDAGARTPGGVVEGESGGGRDDSGRPPGAGLSGAAGRPTASGESFSPSPRHALSPSAASGWTRIHVREPSGAAPEILASRSEIRDGEFQSFAGWGLVPLGSTAYKLARLAEGTADVFLSRGPKGEWDVCAGALLVQEAGGIATDLRGEPLAYNRPDPRVYGVLAAAAGLHAEVLRRVRELSPPERLARPAADPLHPGLTEEDE